ncbi:hypothetical protein A1Q1_00569 [Trichosporon asahii var. asahii CBS 2479]|uniref:Uncharacterized protein n=1 Tax=Trichosporon asahii var. asahii (strain ATCC 90039 / CBS 2479 / JCM 2466 / KCTC 7840 / NBRC 103889/ NCYC 2677 / UAMH 7654) TaxID=1186058 RepID=J6F4C9_TRIAS|nr:hypothetical protein A1Q1_00569 [Trichosporon asahii var. asahii CBS 2479]EJT50102.1 hypothetical protein A1Q1_00569 [Trichosporon asahii var. asahii CBS 2479]
MRVTVSPESTILSPAPTDSTPSARESLLPSRKVSDASTSRASKSSAEVTSPPALGKRRRITAKAHLAPSPDSSDIVLSIRDLPAWTIGFPPHRRVKEALRVSLSCGGIEVESEKDIDGLRHDSGLDFGKDPRLSDLMPARGCHFTFNFCAAHELREEQRIARQNDPERIRKQRLLMRLNPMKQTETFNALTIMSREGLPDGFGGVYTRQDLEYIRDKLIKFAPLEWRTQEWYRDGLREMGIDPDASAAKPLETNEHSPAVSSRRDSDNTSSQAHHDDRGEGLKPRPAISTRLTS